MELQDTSQFYQWLRARLEKKGYVEIGAVQPIDLAFLKASAFGNRVLGVIDTSQGTDSPTQMLQGTEKWFEKLHGKVGTGCLLFLYHGEPPPRTLKEIHEMGGYMTVGAHDLHSGQHWLAMHHGFEQEIYGE
jgi:hypothetical protein